MPWFPDVLEGWASGTRLRIRWSWIFADLGLPRCRVILCVVFCRRLMYLSNCRRSVDVSPF